MDTQMDTEGAAHRPARRLKLRAGGFRMRTWTLGRRLFVTLLTANSPMTHVRSLLARASIAGFLAALAPWIPCSSAHGQGTVSGLITDARSGDPVPMVIVELGHSSLGAFYPEVSGSSDENGRYALTAPSSSLVYNLRVRPAAPLLPSFWPSFPCPATGPCSAPGAGNIAVALGQTFVADVTVTTPGSIEGHVVREQQGTAIAAVRVLASWAEPFGRLLVETQTDATGYYRLEGLPPGPYRVYVAGDPDFVSEIYDNIPCGRSCSVAAAGETPVAVSADSTHAAIDFALSDAAVVTGLVHNNGQPVLGTTVGIRLDRWANGGWEIQDSKLVPAGSAAFAFAGLQPGNYLLSSYSACGAYCRIFVNEVYNDLPCTHDACSEAERAGGTILTLQSGQTTPALDIGLEPAGSISGCIRDAGTDLPLAGVEVIAYDGPQFWGAFAEISSAFSGADGCYRIEYLPENSAGTRLRTFNHAGYADQLSGTIPCLGASCVLTDAIRITMGHDEDIGGMDFLLEAGNSIAGRILARSSGPGIVDAVIGFYDAQANHVRSIDYWRLRTTADGRFHSYGLADGTYYLTATIGEGAVSRVYVYGAANTPGQPPPPVLSGTPIVINNGTSVAHLEFVLEGETVHWTGFEDQ